MDRTAEPTPVSPSASLTTKCCIAGGGPAGMMLGLLLARAGIDVVVLEKHSDFLRDFRGDTLHPSTLEVMHELGLDDRLLALPHQKVHELAGQFGDTGGIMADFRHLPVRHPYIVLMPQWDFLNFLAGEASRYPRFRHRMNAEATDLILHDGRVAGVAAETAEGMLHVKAELVVDCTGRDSRLRARAGLSVQNLGAPIDVLWFRLSRQPADTDQTGGRFDNGSIFVRLNRGDYWQCAHVIPKGGADAIRARGIDAFRATVAPLLPFSTERADELRSFDDVKLLSVAVDRLATWHRPGFLCIGDAAHAMSPVGGVGINLAIQDAVAAANILAGPLRSGTLSNDDLAEVQRRRLFPTRLTQAAQIFAQNRVLAPALAARQAVRAPLPVRMLARFPMLRRIPARLIGMGVRPEHVRSPDRSRP
ncbi:MAG: FAD-dependent oxidoreductase [Mesorhizobium sp.]|nr:FAD-dependent oxidoreductase [Mesorhizobium sp.]